MLLVMVGGGCCLTAVMLECLHVGIHVVLLYSSFSFIIQLGHQIVGRLTNLLSGC